MKRSLTLKRIFSMGQYQNLEVTDSITDIPEQLALNGDFIASLSIYQMLRLEARFQRYVELRAKTNKMSTEDAISLIEDNTTTALQDVINYTNKQERSGEIQNE